MEDQVDTQQSTNEGCPMAFSPTESPLYGGGTIIVAFSEDTIIAYDADIYLVYEGASQRHTTTTKFIREANTVQANIPDHHKEEEVDLSVYVHSNDKRYILGSQKFQYSLDSAHHITQFLVTSVEDPNSLDELELIQSDKFDLSNEVPSTLDDRLTASFESYDIPENWHLYGSSYNDEEIPEPRETVLHFAARLGLTKLATFLLDQPGGDTAVQMPNRRGELPKDIARTFGMDGLAELLSEYNRHSLMPGLQNSSTRVRTKTAIIRRFHEGTDSISNDLNDNNNRTIDEDIAMLKEYTTDEGQEDNVDGEIVEEEEEEQQQNENSNDGENKEEEADDSNDGDNREVNEEVDEEIKEVEEDNGDGLMEEGTKEEIVDEIIEDIQEEMKEMIKKPKTQSVSWQDERDRQSDEQVDSDQDEVLEEEEDESEDEEDEVVSHVVQEEEEVTSPVEEEEEVASPGEEEVTSPGEEEVTSPVEEDEEDEGENDEEVDDNVGYKTEEEEEEESGDTFPDDYASELSPVTKSPPASIFRPEERKQILEANIQKLHDINEDIERMRMNAEEMQNERRDSLARFSTSCPTLDRSSPPLPDKADFFKSMMHIPVPEDYEHEDDAEDGDDSDYRPEPDYAPGANFAEQSREERRVSIKINDVTMSDSSTDFSAPGSTISHLKMGLRRKEREDLFDDIRRRSWHTNSTPDSGMGRMSRHLAAAGKCFSLSSLDSTEEGVEDGCAGSQTEMMHVGAGADDRSPNTSLNSEPSARSTPLDQVSPGHRPDTASSIRSASDIALDLDTSNENEADDDIKGVHEHIVCSESSPAFANIRLNNSKMTKSVSTPQISSFQANKENDAQARLFNQSGLVQRRSQQTIQEEPRHSQHPSNFENDDDRPKHSKDENKRRRVSMFSKFGSYRQKKKEKDISKSRSSHTYVSVSYSNSRLCDACGKSMANKHALQCENCSVSVHDSSCKDQVAACTKFRHPRVINRTQPIMGKEKGQSLPAAKGSNQGTSFGASPVASSSTTSSVLPSSPEHSSGSTVNMATFQWRRVAAKLGIDRAIDEGEESDVAKSDVHTNMTDTYSVSTESLDDGAGVVDFTDDPDLAIKGPEPEAWSVTVDKKTIKALKLGSKDVKRQDHIWELIQTEVHYFRVLKIMQKIFAQGMSQELLMSQELVGRIFPQLEELLDIHQTFLNRLKERQELRPDKYIENLSDILIDQYGGNMGDRMKKAYGEFCSHHKEGVAFYKDLLKSDRKFQNFIKKCSMNSLCKRMGVTECILFVTQRLTKYPPLIQAIIKPMKDSSKDTKMEKEGLWRSVGLAQDILKHVDEQIHAREKELRLIEIYNRLDARSSTKYRKRDFKKSNLLSTNRKLVKESVIGFKTARGKEVEVLMVLLTDAVLFLEDNGQKYTFLSQDKKSGAVPLYKLIARENGSRRDKRSMYLITQLVDSYDMYEIVCKSKFECDLWIGTFRDAIMKCPDEEEEENVRDEGEEERKIAEAKFAKLHELIGHLKNRDDAIQRCCEERFKVIADMCEMHGYDDILKGLKTIYKENEGVGEVLDPRDLLQAVVQEATRLTYLIQTNSTSLSRSASSAGEHDSGLHMAPELPRRADTFAGFDSIGNGAVNRAGSTKKRNLPEIPCPEGQDGRSASLQNLRQQESDTESLQSPDGVDRVREFKGMGRRPSLLHTLTNLMGKEDSESRTASDKSSDRGSGYFAELSVGSSLQSLVPPSREHTESLMQLSKYVHDLVTFSCRQSTQVDSLRIQLAEAIDRAERFRTAQKSNLERKSTFRANQQLEELRNLQEEVSTDRKKWEKEKSREKQKLEAETSEVDLKQREISKEMEELRSQKEELQRQREAFQRQIDFFQETMATQRQQPNQQNLNSSDKDISQGYKDHLDGSQMKNSPKISHKRSASDDWSKFNDGDPFEPMDVQYSKSLKEPLNKERVDLGQNRAYSTGSAGNLLELGVTSPTYGGKRRESGANSSLPVHLCSATNETKATGVQQKIPVKLSSLASSSGLKSQGSSASLKSQSSSKKDKSASHSSSGSNMNNNSTNQESPNRPSRTSNVSGKANKSPSGIGLPMKLAELGNRKRSDSPSAHQKGHVTSDNVKVSPKNQRREMSPASEVESRKHQQQKSETVPEQKVIYF